MGWARCFHSSAIAFQLHSDSVRWLLLLSPLTDGETKASAAVTRLISDTHPAAKGQSWNPKEIF